MRIRMQLVNIEECVLNFNYNYPLMASFLRLISIISPSLSEDLHSSKVKFFTFSRLYIDNVKSIRTGLIVFKDAKIKITFSSPDNRITTTLLRSLSKSDTMKIGSCEFFIESFKAFDPPDFKDCPKFKLLSPVVISRPVEMNGKLTHEYIGPDHAEYSQRFARNLEKRYELFFGEKPLGSVLIKPDERYIRSHRTSKLIDIKGVKIRGHIFPFTLCGDERLIEFGYEAGFGERTPMGFGFAEVVRRR